MRFRRLRIFVGFSISTTATTADSKPAIAVACRDIDVRNVKALIIGPHETPYEFGFFEVRKAVNSQVRRADKFCSLLSSSPKVRPYAVSIVLFIILTPKLWRRLSLCLAYRVVHNNQRRPLPFQSKHLRQRQGLLVSHLPTVFRVVAKILTISGRSLGKQLLPDLYIIAWNTKLIWRRTWRGERGEEWSSAQGLESILLSIQSLMSSNPYENEPGYEKIRNPSEVGLQKSYCQKVRIVR